MAELAVRGFPFIAGVLGVVICMLAIRLDRRTNRGGRSAGQRDPDRPTPPGQATTPWELRAIEEQLSLLRTLEGHVLPRHDLNATVNRLLVAAKLDGPGDQLPAAATDVDLAAAIGRIEHQLGIEPMDEYQQS